MPSVSLIDWLYTSSGDQNVHGTSRTRTFDLSMES